MSLMNSRLNVWIMAARPKTLWALVAPVILGTVFAYGDGITVLADITLAVKPGQTIAFVGQTGSGKSTLMKLLLRFYQPTAGRIVLDGLDLSDIALADIRQAIGLVSQEAFLGQGNIRDNIAYGRPQA